MEVARAVALCSVSWALSACVRAGAVLWHEVADASSEAPSSTTTGDSTSHATTGEPTTTLSATSLAEESTGGDLSTSSSEDRSTGESPEESSPPGSSTAGTSADGSSADGSSVDGSSGSEVTCIAVEGSSAEILIDDLEDGDIVLPTPEGRSGWWWSQTDGTPGLRIPEDPWTPSTGDAVSGEFAAHVSAEGFAGWGVQLGVTLNEECSYDASLFSGVEFWARGTGIVRMRFTTLSTTPVDHEPPGTCTGPCWDDFGIDVELTESWTRYFVAWDELEQLGWGESAEFDPIELVGFHWMGGGAMTSFDLWVDDVRFAPADQDGL